MNAKSFQKLRLLATLIIGIITGFILSQLLHSSNNLLNLIIPHKLQANSKECLENDYFITSQKNRVLAASEDEVTEGRHRLFSSESVNNGLSMAMVNNTLAAELYNKTRVLCWILTGPQNHMKRAIHVKATWGSRCNILLFMSSEEDEVLGSIKLPVREGRGRLWQKTREAMKYVYRHYYHKADWFLKADDDTYVIVENLRAFLYPFSPDAPVYFGCKFKALVQQGYMSGGAGYVLSKEALRRFAVRAYPNPKICRQDSIGAEDREMGFCLQNVGVVAGDSRDELKRGRFFPLKPQNHIVPKDKRIWYWRYVYYKTKEGVDCCSDYAISFHYIPPNNFYVMDYLIYNLHAFGTQRLPEQLPQKVNMPALLKKWRSETSDNSLNEESTVT